MPHYAHHCILVPVDDHARHCIPPLHDDPVHPPLTGAPLASPSHLLQPALLGPPAPPPPPTPAPLPAPASPDPGLLYTDGRDTRGRPVVVLNTMAMPAEASRDEALEYVLHQLQPIVTQVCVPATTNRDPGVCGSYSQS